MLCMFQPAAQRVRFRTEKAIGFPRQNAIFAAAVTCFTGAAGPLFGADSQPMSGLI
jgi:hypothetical protein